MVIDQIKQNAVSELADNLEATLESLKQLFQEEKDLQELGYKVDPLGELILDNIKTSLINAINSLEEYTNL